MASDLSQLIKDSFTLTLNGLLGKDARIINITKAHPYDIEDTQLLEVQSTFDFSNFSSKFTYLIPAQGASLIFNTMMGLPITDLSSELDDDSEDAINEFVSNTCGGLTTAINGSEFEDVGQTKFNISHKEILNGNDITDLERTFRFEIDLEDHELILYLAFDELILEHISELTESKITFHEERKKPETEDETEVDSEEKESEQTDKDTNEIQEEPKNKKLKLLILGIGGLLTFILLSFLVLFFTGFFDVEPPKEIVQDTNTTKIEPKKVDVIKYAPVKKIDFQISDINKDRLNRKLEILTKYTVLNKEEIEAQKIEEKNRLFELEREKELLAFSQKNIEEALFEKKELKVKAKVDTKTQFKEENFSDENTTTENINTSKDIVSIAKKTDVNNKIFYAVTTSLKYNLFKTLVQETKTEQARISICNDSLGKTTIYIGPFESEILQQKMIELTKKQSSDIEMIPENITEEEFNTRCTLE